MASIVNSIISYTSNTAPTNNVFDGKNWEEVENFNFVNITVSYQGAVAGGFAAAEGKLFLEWANSPRNGLPDLANDIIASEEITIPHGTPTPTVVSHIRDHRGSWFRIRFTTTGGIASLNISTVYKTGASEIKICDEGIQTGADIVSVGTRLSLQETLSNTAGNSLRSTISSQTTGDSLHVNLRDNLGSGLQTQGNVNENRSIGAGIIDTKHRAISSVKIQPAGTNVQQANMYGTYTNSIGQVQGTTAPIRNYNTVVAATTDGPTDAAGTTRGTSGVAQYTALGDINGEIIASTATSNRDAAIIHPLANSMFGALVDTFGRTQEFYNGSGNGADAIDTSHETLWVDVSADPAEGIYTFNIENGIKTTLSTFTGANNNNINLFNLFIYNNSPVTTWLKVYDMCLGEFNLNRVNSVNTISVPAQNNTFTNALVLPTTFTNIPITQGALTGATMDFRLTGVNSNNIGITLIQQLDTQKWYFRNNEVPQAGGTITILSVSNTTNATNLSLTIGTTYVIANPTTFTSKDGVVNVFDLKQGATTVTPNLFGDWVTNYASNYSYTGSQSPKVGTLGVADVYIDNIIIKSGGTNYAAGGVTINIPGVGAFTGNITVITEDLNYQIFSPSLKLNIPCPAKGYRDLKLLRGTEFTKGLYVRSTYEHSYASSRGPSTDNELFVSGTYVSFSAK